MWVLVGSRGYVFEEKDLRPLIPCDPHFSIFVLKQEVSMAIPPIPKQSVKLGVILFMTGLIILSHTEVWGADWRHYGTTDGVGQFYYDKDSIAFLPGGVVRVWARTIKDEDLKKAIEEKKKAIQKFIERRVSGKKAISEEESKKIYEEWQKEFLRNLVIPEKRMLIELRCGDKMYRLLSGTEYDEKGNAQKGFSAPQAQWLQIIPESPIEGLYKIACPQESK